MVAAIFPILEFNIMSRAARRTPSLVRPVIAAAAAVAVLLAGQAAWSSPAAAENRPTPRDFGGYGFDQCETVSQAKMNRWLTHSPFFAVGVYISGNSRFCREQKNLTPTWVARQLRAGWRILPITLGPQSTCVGRFPRYGPSIDPTISENSANRWHVARSQGAREAEKAVAEAKRLGITKGSTLWYDLEGWSDYRDWSCRESALSFLSTWTLRLHQLGYVSGVYSSAGSGMRILDDARVQRPRAFHLPDRIWIARWDGRPNTSTSYIREDGWRPGNRMKQYRGGHNETWGGATINIDSNYLDLGRGSWLPPMPRHCGDVRLNWPTYGPVGPGGGNSWKIRTLQCLLKKRNLFFGEIHGRWDLHTRRAANVWRRNHGQPVTETWTSSNWMALLSNGSRPVVKIGTADYSVRRLQMALNADSLVRLPIDGVIDTADVNAIRNYQRRAGAPVTGVAAPNTWALLQRGRR
jgi:hypothetical protein